MTADVVLRYAGSIFDKCVMILVKVLNMTYFKINMNTKNFRSVNFDSLWASGGLKFLQRHYPHSFSIHLTQESDVILVIWVPDLAFFLPT